MALVIRNRKAERLAQALAGLTGETGTQAVTVALRELLGRVSRQRPGRRLADELDEIGLRSSTLPVLDGRQADEALGHDGCGLPS